MTGEQKEQILVQDCERHQKEEVMKTIAWVINRDVITSQRNRENAFWSRTTNGIRIEEGDTGI